MAERPIEESQCQAGNGRTEQQFGQRRCFADRLTRPLLTRSTRVSAVAITFLRTRSSVTYQITPVIDAASPSSGARSFRCPIRSYEVRAGTAPPCTLECGTVRRRRAPRLRDASGSRAARGASYWRKGSATSHGPRAGQGPASAGDRLRRRARSQPRTASATITASMSSRRASIPGPVRGPAFAAGAATGTHPFGWQVRSRTMFPVTSGGTSLRLIGFQRIADRGDCSSPRLGSPVESTSSIWTRQEHRQHAGPRAASIAPEQIHTAPTAGTPVLWVYLNVLPGLY